MSGERRRSSQCPDQRGSVRACGRRRAIASACCGSRTAILNIVLGPCPADPGLGRSRGLGSRGRPSRPPSGRGKGVAVSVVRLGAGGWQVAIRPARTSPTQARRDATMLRLLGHGHLQVLIGRPARWDLYWSDPFRASGMTLGVAGYQIRAGSSCSRCAVVGTANAGGDASGQGLGDAIRTATKRAVCAPRVSQKWVCLAAWARSWT